MVQVLPAGLGTPRFALSDPVTSPDLTSSIDHLEGRGLPRFNGTWGGGYFMSNVFPGVNPINMYVQKIWLLKMVQSFSLSWT